MDTNKLLVEWMERNAYTNRTLADSLGFTYDLLYKVTSGERPVSEGFRWRFAQRFGWNEAVAIFGDAGAPSEVTPAQSPVQVQALGA